MQSIVQEYVEQMHADVNEIRSGAVADYLPELSPADADAFGICIATQDGHLYEAGDTRAPFSIQSISKPFTYGLAIADRGLELVSTKVDVEPSGEAFNEVSLDPTTGRPRNAMINAGAIAAASLVRGDTPAEQFERVRRRYSQFAGRELVVDEAVFAAELAAGHRNRASGHLLRSFGILDTEPDNVLDVYLRQCSVEVECRDLAMMAATLANGGTHPLTGVEAMAPAVVQHVLSVMTTCGMYDAAGDWVTSVGLPAKSGVGGGILAVLPGQLGIAVYSPRLDPHGSSVRGVEACQRLSRDLDLHFLHVTRGSRAAVRATYDITSTPSGRHRSEDEQRILTEHGPRVRVYELHGDLLFSGAESVVRIITDQIAEVDAIVLEMSRVDEVGEVARSMFTRLRRELRDAGRDGVLVDPDGTLADPGVDTSAVSRVFPDLRSAVEACEDRLITRFGAGTVPATDSTARHDS